MSLPNQEFEERGRPPTDGPIGLHCTSTKTCPKSSADGSFAQVVVSASRGLPVAPVQTT